MPLRIWGYIFKNLGGKNSQGTKDKGQMEKYDSKHITVKKVIHEDKLSIIRYMCSVLHPYPEPIIILNK